MSIKVLFERATKSLPVVYQSEAAECGLTCLAMVAGYHGHEVSLSVLREKFPSSLMGMTFKDIVFVADQIGMQSRALKVPVEAINQIRLPAILHWNLNHFVVLKNVTKRFVEIHDPSIGFRSLSKAEFSKSFTGVVLELSPGAGFQKKKETLTLKISDLWSSISGLKQGIFQLFGLSLFLQIVILLNPLFLQLIIDEVMVKSNFGLLPVLVTGFAGLSLVSGLAAILRSLSVIYLGSTISFQIASNLFMHLLSLPLDYFEKRHMGDVTSRFQSIEPIKRLLTEDVVTAIIDGFMAITTLVVMFLYSPLLASISLGAWSAYFAFKMALARAYREKQEMAIRSGANENSLFMESVRSMPSLKLFGVEKGQHRLWLNHFADVVNADAAVGRFRAWFDGGGQIFNGLELVAVVAVATQLVMANEFTVGMLLAYLAYRASFGTNASRLIEKAVEFRLLRLHLDRLADIVHTSPEILPFQPNEEIVAERTIEGSLELRGVSYQYSINSPRVLEKIDLKVRAGESIAIVGRTGCGKSTLLKVLTSLFTPTEGQVLVDGMSIHSIGCQSYRRQIGVVLQEDSMLSGTIAETISFGDNEPDMDAVMDAARLASVLEDIFRLPMKFNSQIGDMGSSLSAGQKQRIAMARALYRRPKILFLDEATSHLDVGTEKSVSNSLSELGITRVVVAHRPETIKAADRVFLLEQGKLSEVQNELTFGTQKISLKRHTRSEGGGRSSPSLDSSSTELLSHRDLA